MYLIETERLFLRRKNIGDAPQLYALNSDPDVVQYTGNPPFESLEAAQEFVRNYNPYDATGMGRWAVIDKETKDLVGWCGLKLCEDYVDLGYRFFKKHWGKGYATESSIGCLRHGFDNLGLSKIVGIAMKENSASIRVLDKIGMKYEKDYTCACEPAVLYAIYKEEFETLYS